MAKIIKTASDLNRLLEQRATMALKSTQKIVSKAIQESINEYYKEKVFRDNTSAIPEIYERTYKLLNSLVKTDIIKTGNTLQCEVKIDEHYLNYRYPGTDGWAGITATGRDVLEWNSEYGSHGGTVDGDWKIWEQAMESLGGDNGIMSILVSNLKKYGLNAK